MICDGNAWRHEVKPVGEAKWTQTMTYKSIKCIFKETSFNQECSNCNITTVTGIVGSDCKAGSAIRGSPEL